MSAKSKSPESNRRNLTSGKSASSRSKSPSKKMLRSASTAGSTNGSEGGKKVTHANEEVDENGTCHIDLKNQGLTSIAPTIFERKFLIQASYLAFLPKYI